MEITHFGLLWSLSKPWSNQGYPSNWHIFYSRAHNFSRKVLRVPFHQWMTHPQSVLSNIWGQWNLHQSFKTTKIFLLLINFPWNDLRQSQITHLPLILFLLTHGHGSTDCTYRAWGAPTILEPLGLIEPYQNRTRLLPYHNRTSLIPEILFLSGAVFRLDHLAVA